MMRKNEVLIWAQDRAALLSSLHLPLPALQQSPSTPAGQGPLEGDSSSITRIQSMERTPIQA